MGGKPIKEFIGLRSKMYSILSEAGEQKNTAKGVSRSVSENILTHEDYRKCLFMKKSMKNKMMRFFFFRFLPQYFITGLSKLQERII